LDLKSSSSGCARLGSGVPPPSRVKEFLWGVGFYLLRLAAVASLVSVSAAFNSTAHKVSITVLTLTFYRCFINLPSSGTKI